MVNGEYASHSLTTLIQNITENRLRRASGPVHHTPSVTRIVQENIPGSVAEMRAPNLRQSNHVKKDKCGKI